MKKPCLKTDFAIILMFFRIYRFIGSTVGLIEGLLDEVTGCDGTVCDETVCE